MGCELSFRYYGNVFLCSAVDNVFNVFQGDGIDITEAANVPWFVCEGPRGYV